MVDNDGPLSQDKATDEGDDHKEALDPHFWLAQLSLAKRAGDTHLKDSEDAWLEYLGKRNGKMSVKDARIHQATKFPIFWSTVKTIQPALYSKTPTIMSERMLDEDEDEIARQGSIKIERLGKYLIKACPFDRVQYATRDDFILTGKTTNRVCYYEPEGRDTEEDYEPPKRYYEPVPQPDGSTALVDADGAPPPPGLEIRQGDDGTSYALEPDGYQEKASVTLEPVSFKDIRHNPDARHWEEIDWISFRLYLNKSDVKKRFGAEIAERVPYSSGDQKKRGRGTVEAHDRDNNYAAIWETWDKETKKVYFVCEGFEDDFLEEPKDDPYGLPGYFPCPPFMIGTCETDSLYPVPDFVQLRPLIEQIHALADRLRINIRATKKRGLFDNAIEELKNLDSLTDAEWIGVSNMQAILNKGGLEKLVQFFPTGEIAALVEQLKQLLQEFEAFFRELWGIPDILTGTSDPEETAEAQKLKQKNVGTRFRAIVREFQRLIRDDIEILCDVALAKFSDQRLAEIMGVRFDSPQEQQLFPQVLAFLRQTDERGIRVNIQTDSTILTSELEELERRQGLMTEVMQSFTQLLQIGNGQPAVMKVGLELILYTIRSMPDGKQIEDELSQAIQAMLQPPPPPPPDPNIAIEQQKIQLQGQELQQKVQTEQGWMQIETQKNQAAAQVKEMEAQLKAQDLKLEQQEQSFRQQLDSFKAKLDQIKVASDTMGDKSKTENDAMKIKMDTVLTASQMKQDKADMALEHAKALHEMAMAHRDHKAELLSIHSENMRHHKDHVLAAHQGMQEGESKEEQGQEEGKGHSHEGASKQPSIVIHNHLPPYPGKRKFSVERNPMDGEISGGELEDIPHE